jgi:hypothetical protein
MEAPPTYSGCKSVVTTEMTMTSTEKALRLPKAQTRAMRVSVDEAQRQLVLSLWLVALLLAATAVTATAGLFA